MDLGAYSIRAKVAGHLKHDPNWHWQHKGGATDSFLLWLITEGLGHLRAGADEYELRAGDCLITRMWEPHEGQQDPAQLLGIPWVVFDFLDSSGQAVRPDPWPRRHRRVEDAALLERLMARAIQAKLCDGERSPQADAWLAAALWEATAQDEAPPYTGWELEQYQRIEALCTQIRQFPGYRYAIADLARQFHCSSDHFIRLFRKFKGDTPREFIILARIEEAKRLLAGTSQSLAQIAESLGYRDIYHFGKQFRQRTGISPGRFRAP